MIAVHDDRCFIEHSGHLQRVEEPLELLRHTVDLLKVVRVELRSAKFSRSVCGCDLWPEPL